MKKIILVLVVISSFTWNLLAQDDASRSKWNPNGIVIDGKDNDWIKPLNFYDDKSGLMFAIENDSKDLYFCFTNNDNLKMKKMINAGWKMDLTSKGKHKKFKAELLFPPVKMMRSGMRRDADRNESKATENSMISFYKANIPAIQIKGFKSEKTGVKLNDQSDINIGIGADSTQHIIYEIAIPLRELYDPKGIRFDELMTLNITINAMERPSAGGGYSGGMSGRGGGRSGGGRSGGGRMGGGMPGMGGGGMSRGGNGGGGFAGMSSMFESVSFKQKFTLSSNK
jgi:hypothetical protein